MHAESWDILEIVSIDSKNYMKLVEKKLLGTFPGESHEYELYLSIEDIDHTRTKTKSPQTNGICERFHQTIQNEFYATAFRKKIYFNIEELQEDVEKWVKEYNEERPHSGKYCYGKTPWQTFQESKHLAQAKMLDEMNLTEEAVR